MVARIKNISKLNFVEFSDREMHLWSLLRWTAWFNKSCGDSDLGQAQNVCLRGEKGEQQATNPPPPCTEQGEQHRKTAPHKANDKPLCAVHAGRVAASAQSVFCLATAAWRWATKQVLSAVGSRSQIWGLLCRKYPKGCQRRKPSHTFRPENFPPI